MIALAIIAAPFVLYAITHAARRARRDDRDRRRLEAMDEHRAANVLYLPTRRVEAAPIHPPTVNGRHE